MAYSSEDCNIRELPALDPRYHAAFTVSPDLVAVYLDGSQLASSSSTGYTSQGTVPDAWIGRHHGFPYYKNLYLMDYRVYSTALP